MTEGMPTSGAAAADNGIKAAAVARRAARVIMVIGALSGISYPAFSAALAPVALFGLIAVIVIVRIVYRAEFTRTAELAPHISRGRMRSVEPVIQRAAGDTRKAISSAISSGSP